MNCDQAFDAMTDPLGMDAPELMYHLASCTRCRQMFETLEPALGLFNPPGVSDPHESERQITRALVSPVQMAEQVAARLSASRQFNGTRVNGIRATQSRLWGTLFSATALGLLLCLSLTLLLSGTHSSFPSMADQCSWLNRGVFSGDESASIVTSSCVTCHSVRQTSKSDGQAVLINFSMELEHSVRRWQQALQLPGVSDCLIAQHAWKGRLHV